MMAIYTLVGMRYLNKDDFNCERFVRELPKFERLTLKRDPNNQHDFNCVQVWARGRQIGFVKGTEVAQLARKMDGRNQTEMEGLLTADRWPTLTVNE